MGICAMQLQNRFGVKIKINNKKINHNENYNK